MARTKVVAIATGLAVGWFLLFRFKFLGPGSVPLASFGLFRLTYQTTLLLAAIGLGGVFPAARLWGPFGIAVAPVLYLWANSRSGRPDPEGLGFLLIAFVLTASAPLAGGVVSLLLRRKQMPRLFYPAILAGTLAAGAVLPGIVRGGETEVRHRREYEQIGTLLRGIYEAEMSYSAGRPRREFSCDGSELPGMSGLRWISMGSFPNIENNPTQKFAESVGARWTKANNYAFQNGIHLLLACRDGANPDGFRAFAFSSVLPAPTFSIDESGVLRVSGDSYAPQSDGAPVGR